MLSYLHAHKASLQTLATFMRSPAHAGGPLLLTHSPNNINTNS
jgi:hypothetical protein